MMDTENKTPHRKNIADEYAAEIIRQLKEGTAPWQKPWKAGEFHLPFNPSSGTNYRGINVAMLAGHGYADPRWMTFKQAQEKNWKVKKGSKSQRVVFWQWQDRQTMLDDNGRPVLDEGGKEVKETVDLARPRLYVYNAFHLSQIQDEKGNDLPPFEAKEPEWNPHERAEAILRASGLKIVHDQRDRAFYSPSEDAIHLPPKANFPDEGHYYATALHELGHSLGHESRLNWESTSAAYGTPEYAKEELRVEIASWMLCQELGLPYDPGQHVAYANSWIKALEDDPYEIMRACQVAEKIKGKILDVECGLAFGQTAESAEETLFHQSKAGEKAQDKNAALNDAPERRLNEVINEIVYLNLSAAYDGEKADIAQALALSAQKAQEAMDSPDFGAPGTEIESAFIERIRERAAIGAGVSGDAINPLDVLQHAQHEIFVLGHLQANRLGSVNQESMGQWLESYYTDVHELGPAELDRITGKNISFKQEFDGGEKDWCVDRVEGELMCRENAGSPWREPNSEEWKAIEAAGDLDWAPVMPLKDGRFLTMDGQIHGLEQAQEYEVVAMRRVRSADGDQPRPWIEVEDGRQANFFAVTAKDGQIVSTSATLEEAELKAQAKNRDGSCLPTVSDEKVYLDVPFMEKSMVKALGATWDKDQKSWCARPGVDLAPLERWIPEAALEKLADRGVVTAPDAAPEADDQTKQAAIDKAAAVREPAPGKTFLNVPYREKEAAKKLGAKWDRNAGLWYAPEGTDLTHLAKYIPEKTPAPAKAISPETEFAQALEKAGLKIEGLPIIDGKIHRVPTVDGRPGNRDGAYCAYADGRPAGWMMNYRTGGEKVKWMATGQTLTVEQKASLLLQAEERRAEREAQRQEEQKEAIEKAVGKWRYEAKSGWGEIDSHPYLAKKGVIAYGLKEDRKGNLMVPGYDQDGKLQTIQTINAQGGKFFEPGCPKAGAMHIIGEDEENGRPEKIRDIKAPQIYISEGYATGASVYLATKNPVVMAFDANNLKAVAMAIREIHPEANIVLCADNDHKNDKNVGLEKAQEAAKAVGGEVISPEFTKEEQARGLTDFNDLHQARGLGAVRDAFQKQQLGRAAAQIRPAVSQKSVKSAGMSL